MKHVFAPHRIVAVHITDRVREAPTVQQVLTNNGHLIKTRLGLHEVETDVEGINGLLLMETVGAEAEVAAMMSQLSAIDGVEVKSMVFEH